MILYLGIKGGRKSKEIVLLQLNLTIDKIMSNDTTTSAGAANAAASAKSKVAAKKATSTPTKKPAKKKVAAKVATPLTEEEIIEKFLKLRKEHEEKEQAEREVEALRLENLRLQQEDENPPTKKADKSWPKPVLWTVGSLATVLLLIGGLYLGKRIFGDSATAQAEVEKADLLAGFYEARKEDAKAAKEVLDSKESDRLAAQKAEADALVAKALADAEAAKEAAAKVVAQAEAGRLAQAETNRLAAIEEAKSGIPRICREIEGGGLEFERFVNLKTGFSCYVVKKGGSALDMFRGIDERIRKASGKSYETFPTQAQADILRACPVKLPGMKSWVLNPGQQAAYGVPIGTVPNDMAVVVIVSPKGKILPALELK